MSTHKVERHRNSDTKTGNREPQQNYRLGTLEFEDDSALQQLLYHMQISRTP